MQWSEYGGAPTNIDILFEHLEKYPINKKINIKKKQTLYYLLDNFRHFLNFFHYFGIWEVKLQEKKADASSITANYRASSIVITPLFALLKDALYDTWNMDSEVDHWIEGLELFSVLLGESNELGNLKQILSEQRSDNEINDEEVSFFSRLQSLFPPEDLSKSYVSREDNYVAGRYLFKVTLNKRCSKTVELSSTNTLLDFHNCIQQAFELNDDHLYAFYMDNNKFSRRCYNSPMDNYGPFVHEVVIGMLNLYKGQSFLYLFNFGDEIEFNIDVLKIENVEFGV
ncbi:hypothetical protein BKP45_06670 [Anaerobacillus alkalidiazotrophicus]|uniref:Plasmid pRiA4b Orf3-like domain-containing protein n=1 Tax=Anaerobacillus alkalidiazotrophicus TaxID=472963 RepID=A0A1S2MEN4_9BACI|nr:hypothetical protein [Anaerobacillus alkalidiazotrophicus]OIJ22317.1 hypothetical protein BKP45_06670 [Anaerobacillus alkalidiazotrophicus]